MSSSFNPLLTSSDIFCVNLRMPLEEHRQAPVDGDGDAVTRDDDNGDEDEQRTCTGLRMCLPVNHFGLQNHSKAAKASICGGQSRPVISTWH